MTSSSGGRAFATLNRPVPTDPAQVGELLARASAKSEVLGELSERSRALGHELIGWLRHDDEYISYCERCGARIYTRLATQRTEDGEALVDACRPAPWFVSPGAKEEHPRRLPTEDVAGRGRTRVAYASSDRAPRGLLERRNRVSGSRDVAPAD
jgi:hypothetical protein